MSEMSLKRGWGLVFSGTNWKLAGDKQWLDHRMYVPNGREPLMGTRPIRGREYAVFRCLDDDYFAQPVELCREPQPDDIMLVMSEPPIDNP